MLVGGLQEKIMPVITHRPAGLLVLEILGYKSRTAAVVV